MNHRTRYFAQVQRGLTLIELLIALALGLLLVAALGYLYAGQRQSWRTLEAVARLQENGRYALELLGQDLRMVGYGGCLSLAELKPVLRAKLDDAAKNDRFKNLLNLFLQQGQVVQGFAGWGVDRNLDGSVNAGDRPDNYLAGTDTLLVVGGANPALAPSAAMANTAAAIPLAGNSRGFRQGELSLVADCERGDVFRVSDDNPAYQTGGNPINHTHPIPHDVQRNTSSLLSKSYGAGAMVMPLDIHVYYLRRRVAGVLPSLYRLPWARDGVGPGGAGWGSSEELIEGVEAMRIVYGVDANNDGAVDVYRTAAGVSDWSQVRAVRVSLLMASQEDGVATTPQTYTWDTDNDGELDDPVTASDRRLRLVFTSTFALRNRP